MDESFRIYIDRLKDGRVQKIDENYDPSFLEIKERELVFDQPVKVEGEAYLTNDSLIIQLTIGTEVKLPCIICNELVKELIDIEGFIHVEPLDEIRGGIYDFSSILRDEILLALPHFVECNDGNCSKRKDFEKYLKKPNSNHSEEEYHPFADL